jgi:hypothetical protein
VGVFVEWVEEIVEGVGQDGHLSDDEAVVEMGCPAKS